MIPDKKFVNFNLSDLEVDDICENLISDLPKDLLAKNIMLEKQLSRAIYTIVSETKGQLTIEAIDTLTELLSSLKILKSHHN